MLPRPIRSNSHKVSGAVGATCRHSNVRLAIPSREVLGKYLNISSIVCPPVPRRLHGISTMPAKLSLSYSPSSANFHPSGITGAL